MKENPLDTIKKEERSGGPRPCPTTREVPPTDEELLFIDRLRKADAIGGEAFMMSVLSGNDITKPTTINAVLDILRHLERLEKRAQATDERLAAQVAHLDGKIRDTEKMVGEEVKGLEAEIQKATATIDAVRARLPWWFRRGKDRVVPPKSEQVAPSEAGAGK